jgi:hypothetical protein
LLAVDRIEELENRDDIEAKSDDKDEGVVNKEQ